MQNSTNCHFNPPGRTRRRSVKGMLALFCYILTSRLLYFSSIIGFLDTAARKSVRFDQKLTEELLRENKPHKEILVNIYLFEKLHFF